MKNSEGDELIATRLDVDVKKSRWMGDNLHELPEEKRPASFSSPLSVSAWEESLNHKYGDQKYFDDRGSQSLCLHAL